MHLLPPTVTVAGRPTGDLYLLKATALHKSQWEVMEQAPLMLRRRLALPHLRTVVAEGCEVTEGSGKNEMTETNMPELTCPCPVNHAELLPLLSNKHVPRPQPDDRAGDLWVGLNPHLHTLLISSTPLIRLLGRAPSLLRFLSHEFDELYDST